MSEFEQVQSLIRLKRHERPPEDFLENFVSAFQQRQRSELLNQSARGLLWERITTHFSGFFNPRWAWAGATAAVAVLGFWMLRPAGGSSQIAKNESAAQAPFVVGPTQFITVEDEPPDVGLQRYLLGNHYSGGFFNEQKPQGNVLPAGFRIDVNNGRISR